MKAFATFRLGGQEWTAYHVSKAELRAMDPTKNLEGLCDYEKCHLYVRRFKSVDRMRDVFLHELAHAFLDSTGVGHWLEGRMKDPDAWVDTEEDLIRLLVPHLAQLIDDMTKDED